MRLIRQIHGLLAQQTSEKTLSLLEQTNRSVTLKTSESE
jgi:hypothetical protein